MRLLYTNDEGGLSIVVPSERRVTELRKTLTALEAMEHIAANAIPAGTPYEIVPVAAVPSDRTFRNAWEHDTSAAPEKVKTNMSKAKIIAHEMRRAARDEAFKPLDIQATIPAQASAAEEARQSIRDADAQKQIDIDAATNEAELKLLVL